MDTVVKQMSCSRFSTAQIKELLEENKCRGKKVQWVQVAKTLISNFSESGSELLLQNVFKLIKSQVNHPLREVDGAFPKKKETKILLESLSDLITHIHHDLEESDIAVAEISRLTAVILPAVIDLKVQLVRKEKSTIAEKIYNKISTLLGHSPELIVDTLLHCKTLIYTTLRKTEIFVPVIQRVFSSLGAHKSLLKVAPELYLKYLVLGKFWLFMTKEVSVTRCYICTLLKVPGNFIKWASQVDIPWLKLDKYNTKAILKAITISTALQTIYGKRCRVSNPKRIKVKRTKSNAEETTRDVGDETMLVKEDCSRLSERENKEVNIEGSEDKSKIHKRKMCEGTSEPIKKKKKKLKCNRTMPENVQGDEDTKEKRWENTKNTQETKVATEKKEVNEANTFLVDRDEKTENSNPVPENELEIMNITHECKAKKKKKKKKKDSTQTENLVVTECGMECEVKRDEKEIMLTDTSKSVNEDTIGSIQPKKKKRRKISTESQEHVLQNDDDDCINKMNEEEIAETQELLVMQSRAAVSEKKKTVAHKPSEPVFSEDVIKLKKEVPTEMVEVINNECETSSVIKKKKKKKVLVEVVEAVNNEREAGFVSKKKKKKKEILGEVMEAVSGECETSSIIKKKKKKKEVSLDIAEVANDEYETDSVVKKKNEVHAEIIEAVNDECEIGSVNKKKKAVSVEIEETVNDECKTYPITKKKKKIPAEMVEAVNDDCEAGSIVKKQEEEEEVPVANNVCKTGSVIKKKKKKKKILAEIAEAVNEEHETGSRSTINEREVSPETQTPVEFSKMKIGETGKQKKTARVLSTNVIDSEKDGGGDECKTVSEERDKSIRKNSKENTKGGKVDKQSHVNVKINVHKYLLKSKDQIENLRIQSSNIKKKKEVAGSTGFDQESTNVLIQQALKSQSKISEEDVVVKGEQMAKSIIKSESAVCTNVSTNDDEMIHTVSPDSLDLHAEIPLVLKSKNEHLEALKALKSKKVFMQVDEVSPELNLHATMKSPNNPEKKKKGATLKGIEELFVKTPLKRKKKLLKKILDLVLCDDEQELKKNILDKLVDKVNKKNLLAKGKRQNSKQGLNIKAEEKRKKSIKAKKKSSLLAESTSGISKERRRSMPTRCVSPRRRLRTMSLDFTVTDLQPEKMRKTCCKKEGMSASLLCDGKKERRNSLSGVADSKRSEDRDHGVGPQLSEVISSDKPLVWEGTDSDLKEASLVKCKGLEIGEKSQDGIKEHEQKVEDNYAEEEAMLIADKGTSLKCDVQSVCSSVKKINKFPKKNKPLKPSGSDLELDVVYEGDSDLVIVYEGEAKSLSSDKSEKSTSERDEASGSDGDIIPCDERRNMFTEAETKAYHQKVLGAEMQRKVDDILKKDDNEVRAVSEPTLKAVEASKVIGEDLGDRASEMLNKLYSQQSLVEINPSSGSELEMVEAETSNSDMVVVLETIVRDTGRESSVEGLKEEFMILQTDRRRESLDSLQNLTTLNSVEEKPLKTTMDETDTVLTSSPSSKEWNSRLVEDQKGRKEWERTSSTSGENLNETASSDSILSSTSEVKDVGGELFADHIEKQKHLNTTSVLLLENGHTDTEIERESIIYKETPCGEKQRDISPSSGVGSKINDLENEVADEITSIRGERIQLSSDTPEVKQHTPLQKESDKCELCQHLAKSCSCSIICAESEDLVDAQNQNSDISVDVQNRSNVINDLEEGGNDSWEGAHNETNKREIGSETEVNTCEGMPNEVCESVQGSEIKRNDVLKSSQNKLIEIVQGSEHLVSDTLKIDSQNETTEIHSVTEHQVNDTVKDAQNETTEMLNGSKHEVNDTLKDQQSETTEMLSSSEHQVNDALKDAQNETGMLNSSEHQGNATIKDAQNETTEMLNGSEHQGNDSLKDAQNETTEMLNGSEHQGNDTLKDAQNETTEMLNGSEHQGNVTLKDAQNETGMLNGSEHQGNATIKGAQNETTEMLNGSEHQGNDTLKDAQNETTEMLNGSEHQINTLKNSQNEGNGFASDSEDEVNEILQDPQNGVKELDRDSEIEINVDTIEEDDSQNEVSELVKELEIEIPSDAWKESQGKASEIVNLDGSENENAKVVENKVNEVNKIVIDSPNENNFADSQNKSSKFANSSENKENGDEGSQNEPKKIIRGGSENEVDDIANDKQSELNRIYCGSQNKVNEAARFVEVEGKDSGKRIKQVVNGSDNEGRDMVIHGSENEMSDAMEDGQEKQNGILSQGEEKVSQNLLIEDRDTPSLEKLVLSDDSPVSVSTARKELESVGEGCEVLSNEVDEAYEASSDASEDPAVPFNRKRTRSQRTSNSAHLSRVREEVSDSDVSSLRRSQRSRRIREGRKKSTSLNAKGKLKFGKKSDLNSKESSASESDDSSSSHKSNASFSAINSEPSFHSQQRTLPLASNTGGLNENGNKWAGSSKDYSSATETCVAKSVQVVTRTTKKHSVSDSELTRNLQKKRFDKNPYKESVNNMINAFRLKREGLGCGEVNTAEPESLDEHLLCNNEKKEINECKEILDEEEGDEIEVLSTSGLDEDEELAYNLSTVNGGGSGAGEHQDVNRGKLSVGGGSRKLRKRLLHRSCGRQNVGRKKSDSDSSPLKEDIEKSEIPQLKAQCASEAVLAKEVLKFISPKESDEECELVSPGLSNEEDCVRKGFSVSEDLVNSPGRFPLSKKKSKTGFSPRGNKGGIRSPQKVIPEEQDESSPDRLRTAKGSPGYKSPKSNLKSSSSLEIGSANKRLTGKSPKETLPRKSDTHSLDNSTKNTSLRSDALSVDNSLKKTLSKKRDEQGLENSDEETHCEKSDVIESVNSVHKKNLVNKIDILIKDKISLESDSITIASESQEADVWEGQQTAQDKVSSPRVLRSRRNSSASEYSSAAENKNSNPLLSSTEEQGEDNVSVDAENVLDATRNPKIVVYSGVSELTLRRGTEEKAKVKLEKQQSLCLTPTRRSTRLSLAKGVLLGSPMASPSTSSARTSGNEKLQNASVSTHKRTRMHENLQNASPTPRRTRGHNNMQNASPATTSRKTRLQTTGATLSTEDSSSQALRCSMGEELSKTDKATRELFLDKETFQVENASDKENTSVKEKLSTTTGCSMIYSLGRLKHTNNPSKGVPVVVKSSPPPSRCIQEINISSPKHSKLNTQESNLPESSVERNPQTASSLQSTIEDSNVTGRRPRLRRRDVTWTPKQ